MKILKKALFSFSLAFILYLVPLGLIAQPIDPCEDPDLPPCEIPIDSNLIVLIAAAVGFAGKKAYEYKIVSKSL